MQVSFYIYKYSHSELLQRFSWCQHIYIYIYIYIRGVDCGDSVSGCEVHVPGIGCQTVVSVTDPGIRLVGGSGPHEGRVEVYHNGAWGTVCDDGWDLQDATVVCHQLGYGTARGALGFAAFGEGRGPIWYDNVRCSGSEANLTQCTHDGLGVHNCLHSEDAGVICASEFLHI